MIDILNYLTSIHVNYSTKETYMVGDVKIRFGYTFGFIF